MLLVTAALWARCCLGPSNGGRLATVWSWAASAGGGGDAGNSGVQRKRREREARTKTLLLSQLIKGQGIVLKYSLAEEHNSPLTPLLEHRT